MEKGNIHGFPSSDHDTFLRYVKLGLKELGLDEGEKGIYAMGVANALRVVQNDGGDRKKFVYGMPHFDNIFIARAYELIKEVPLREEGTSDEKSWILSFQAEEIGERIIQETEQRLQSWKKFLHKKD